MANGELPILGFHFALELQGKVTGYFNECSGIGSENEIVEHKVVTPDGHQKVMKIPGRLKWGDITLKRSLSNNKEFYDWAQEVVLGKHDKCRRDGSVAFHDAAGIEVGRWEFYKAFPKKWSASDLDVGSDDVMTEEITLAIEGLKRLK